MLNSQDQFLSQDISRPIFDGLGLDISGLNSRRHIEIRREP